jgi:hypothetical protein
MKLYAEPLSFLFFFSFFEIVHRLLSKIIILLNK